MNVVKCTGHSKNCNRSRSQEMHSMTGALSYIVSDESADSGNGSKYADLKKLNHVATVYNISNFYLGLWALV